jgi:hypothetical protein
MNEDQWQQYLHDYNTDVEFAYRKGLAEGRTKALITALQSRFSEIPEETEKQIREKSDSEELKKLLDQAWTCNTLEEFQTALNNSTVPGDAASREPQYAKVVAKSVLTVLGERFSTIPAETEERIRRIIDVVELKELKKSASDCSTLEEFQALLE